MANTWSQTVLVLALVVGAAFSTTSTADKYGAHSPVLSAYMTGAVEQGNTTAVRSSTPSLELSSHIQSALRSAQGIRPLDLDRRLGYGPEPADVDDEVVIFEGVKAPLVIGKVTVPADTAQQCYEIIGPEYVGGVMQGELFIDAGTVASDMDRRQRLATETFDVI